MPQTEIPHEDHCDSTSSLSSTPSLRNHRELGGRFQPLSISSNSSIETDPDFENIINVEPFPAAPNYLPVVLPVEPTFDELLKRVTGRDDLHNVESLKIRVISYMVSLQRLPLFMPRLKSLNLDGSVIGSLRDLGCGLVELKYLNVSNCGLRSLDGTNGIPTLEVLVADGNMIENVGPCCNLTDLKTLSLKQNAIKDMGLVSFLSMCSQLSELNLSDNPVTGHQTYRQSIKKSIPTIQLLDEEPLPSSSGGAGDVVDENEGEEPLHSSSSSLEAASSLSSQENTDHEEIVSIDEYNELPSTSQSVYRPRSERAERPLSAASDTIQGTILDKVRKQRPPKSNSSRNSSANSSSHSGEFYDRQFPHKLEQSNVELELGVVGQTDEDAVSNGSEISIGSLQEIVKKWKIECKRKKEEEEGNV